jgi:hypothetical protein
MRTTTLFASISALALMTSGAAYAQTGRAERHAG